MKRKRVVLLVAATLALVAPQVWRYGAAAGRVETSVEVLPGGRAPEIIAVLGAAIRTSTTPSRYLEYRLDVAVDHYSPGITVVVSGDGRDPNWSEPAVMRSYLIERGIASADIVEDPNGLDSMATCRFIAEHYPNADVALVSQTYHLPRAVALCRSVGVDARGIGDERGRVHRETWRNGQLREVAATYKAAIEAIAARLRNS